LTSIGEFLGVVQTGAGRGSALPPSGSPPPGCPGRCRTPRHIGRRPRVALRRPRATGEPLAAELLLVDDSGSLREFTAAMLRDKGFKVTTAAGGAEALARIERDPDRFDVIITDFAMSLLSGLDVIRFAVRSAPAGPPSSSAATPTRPRSRTARQTCGCWGSRLRMSRCWWRSRVPRRGAGAAGGAALIPRSGQN
jgi:CheY-like chemotaxis protein